MSNTLLTISEITLEAVRVLENQLTFANKINRDYDDQFAIEGAKIGDTINIRKPPRYIGRTGAALQIEDSTETSVPLTLGTQFGVDIVFTTKDLTLSIDRFSERFLKPALATVANKIDRDGLQLYQTVANYVGTPGTTPNQLLTYLNAGVFMDNEATPDDGLRTVCLNPQMQATIVNALSGLFNPQGQIGKQYIKGRMGEAANLDWYKDQNVNVHTIGPLGGTPLVTSSGSSGSTLVTRGWTASAASRLKKGDIISIANVNAVNPQNRQVTGTPRYFVVTADFSSDGSGNGSVSISPAIVGPVSATVPAQFQNVDAIPVDGAAITVFGAASTQTPQGLAFHRDAFTLGTADLYLPKGVDMAARVSDKDTGLSVRMVRAYDINNDRCPCRLDVLYGYAAIYPELACRVAG